jgi:alpha-tubulin suppressor-like RCC1 family protein
LTDEGDLTTAVDVQCGQPDPDWNETLGDAWPRLGAVQLWSVDPLSGFAGQKLSETWLSCARLVDQERLAAGHNFSMAVDKQGQVWGWGAAFFNGGGSETHKPVSVDLGGASVVSLEGGTLGSAALDSEGRWWEIGYNHASPEGIDVDALGGVGVVAIEAAYPASRRLLLDEAGHVWVLGQWKSCVNATTSQLDLKALGEAKVVRVAAGSKHILLLDDTGQIWALGDNSKGQLGNGTTVNSCTPVAVDQSAQGGWKAADIVRGGYYSTTSFALDRSGRVWAWGENPFGFLGDGGAVISWENNGVPYRLSPELVQIPPVVAITKITASPNGPFAFALDAGGQLWGWGYNNGGQLGNGTTSSTSTPVQVDQSALEGAEIISMAAGDYHAIALDGEGRLWSWGMNTYGELGDGTITRYRSTPVRVDDSAVGETPWLP